MPRFTLRGFQQDFGTPDGMCPVCGTQIGQELIDADVCPECGDPKSYRKFLEKKETQEPNNKLTPLLI